MTGIDVYVSICMMGVMATLYTVLGGIEAVIWTDVVQVFVLLGGALLSLVVILGDIDGGLGGLIAQGTSADKFHVFNWSWDYTTAAVWVVLVGNLFNNLVPYTSDQAVVQRYLTTKDERSAARGVWLNALMIIPSTMMLFLLGTGLWAFYRARPELLSPSLPTDSIFPLFLSQQLPAGLAGLVIAGVFAASMSTLDSSLNSVATAITADFYGRLNPEADDRRKLRLAKALTALLGAAATGTAIALASLEIGSLWDAFQGMMGLFGAGLAGLFALGIFTTRANGAGALAGGSHECRGAGGCRATTDLHFFLYGMVGILTCFFVGYLTSFALPGGHKPLRGLTITRARNRTLPMPSKRAVTRLAILGLAFALAAPAADSISGRVWSQEGDQRKPLAKALVTLVQEGRRPDPVMARSDAEGKWRIAGPLEGRYFVSAARAGYYVALADGTARSSVLVDCAATCGPVDFELVRGGAVNGIVEDDQGEPIQNVAIALHPRRRGRRGRLSVGARRLRTRPLRFGRDGGPGRSWGGRDDERTDDLGRFRIAGLQPGRYRISADGNRRPGAVR
ncbi:MAG: hypothetical protein R2724_02065 [Bryobacterales bacterium]